MSQGRAKKRKSGVTSGENHTFSSESAVSSPVTSEAVGKKRKRSSRSGEKKSLKTNHTFSSESAVSAPVTSNSQRTDNKRSSRSGGKKTLETNHTFSSESAVSAPVTSNGQRTDKKRSSRSGGKKTLETNHTFSSESAVSAPVTSNSQRTDKKRSSRSGGKKTLETNHTFSSESAVSAPVTSNGQRTDKKRSSRSGGKKTLETNHTFSSESAVSSPVTSNGQRTDKKRSSRSGGKKTLETNHTFSSESEVSNSVKTKGRGNNKKRSSKTENKMNDTPTHTAVYCTIPGCSQKSGFKNKISLGVHVHRNHKHFKCGVCSKIYNIWQFNNFHLKNNPKCAEVDPQPWDEENKKEAEWILTRHDRDGKTTYGCKPGFFKNRKFQCPGCPMSFNSHTDRQIHLKKIHRLVKCVICDSITTIGKFTQTHKQKKLACGKVTPIPWITNEKDADWFVARKIMKGKLFFCIQSVVENAKKKFQCKHKGCIRSYDTKDHLCFHTRTEHNHFKCGVCSKIYNIRHFNKVHLKNNPTCAEVNPQPWDDENKKEAEWILTRHDRDGKTTFGYKSGVFKNRKFQCKFPGCPMSFNSRKYERIHFKRHVRLVKCVVCSLITPLDRFTRTHTRRKLSCGNVKPIPWVKKNQKDPDWFVARRKVRGKSVFCYKSNRGQGPESDADSDENNTFGTESNVYINHSRKPDPTTWLSKYLDRNALTNMTCEVFGCTYHTTHSVVLRHHYKTKHSSLMTNWSVSFDAASEKIHQCFKPKCGFKTNSEHLFEFHNERHTKLFSFQCFLCHQLYKNKNTLMEHLMENHKILRNPNKFVVYIYAQKSKPKRRMEGKSFFCRICCRQIQTRSLENHMNIIHPPKLPQQNCQFCYPEAYCKRSAELSDKTTTLKCCYKTCCFETHTFQEFREHSLTHHFFRSQILAHETNISSSANVSFQCPRKNCKFNARSQMVLSRHENKHRQGLTARCLLCNEICSNTENFLSHVRIRHNIHTNQLALYDDLNEHKGILNIYRCNIESCTGFMSGVKSFYEDHLIHHLDHTSNTFNCGVCSLPLDTGKDLIAHFERSHNKADLAIKSVNIPTTLSCDLCPHLVFNSNAIFILHHQLHHPERVTSVVDEIYPDFYKKSRRFKTFSTSTFRAEGEVECVKM